MRNIIRSISLVLAIAIMMASTPVLADNATVEIGFNVGDDVLIINGTEVQVERPYVVGEGVTLVPLRVITEAFGAVVTWVKETKTVNLSYPNVEIVLQIGNPLADVNGKAERLLSPPELTEGGYTMVPLRFISETFGAVVGWDNVTKRITVTKKAVDTEQSIVTGNTGAEKIGDSYYGWSMNNSSDMSMTYRSFDGMETEFAFDGENTINVSIFPAYDEYDFEKEFVEYKNSLSGVTLVTADKNVSNDKKKVMHFQAKDKEEFLDYWECVTDEYIFSIIGIFDNTNADSCGKGKELLRSFSCDFDSEDTYDLSEVKDGVRTFKSETMKFSIEIPANHYLSSYENVENEFEFSALDEENNTTINCAIYSKSAVVGAKELAQMDYLNNKNGFNPEVVTFCNGVTQSKYKNFESYEYTFDINYNKISQRDRDVFFEVGEYVYNVSVSVKIPSSTADEEIDKVINSIKAEELDAGEIGILMRNDPDREGSYTAKGAGWNIKLPNSYEELSTASDGVVAGSIINGTMLMFQTIAARGTNFGEVKQVVLDMESTARKDTKCEIIKSTSITTIGGTNYAELLILQSDDEGNRVYLRQLAGLKDDKMIVFTIQYNEIAYSPYNINEVETIIKSLEID